METVLVAAVAGVASFFGSWVALRVHVNYLRRDVDHAHKRIDRLDNLIVGVKA